MSHSLFTFPAPSLSIIPSAASVGTRTAAVVVPDSPAESGTPAIVASGLSVLEQGRTVVCQLPAAVYARRHSAAFDASIGGHYRHCLDHFVSLLRSLDSGMVDYDHRDRDPWVEADPGHANLATQSIEARLRELSPGLTDASVSVRCSIQYGDEPAADCRSTLGRELAFVVAHTIHHYALISCLARLSGVSTPAAFGVAPSTLTHHQSGARP